MSRSDVAPDVVPALDPRAILAALGVADATAVTPVAGGWDTAIWRVERPDGPCALRVFPDGREESCRRELAAMRLARSAGIAVPQVHADGQWRERAAYLMSWCVGQPLLDAVRARPWTAIPLGIAFGRVQAAIHTVSVPAHLRPTNDAWIALAGPEEERLQAHLRSLPLRGDALLHLDYHPLNVMVAGGGVSGVLDWANAKAGDPRADLARTVTILRLAPLPPHTPWLVSRAATLLRALLELGWRAGYRRATGPEGALSQDLAPFYAWAGAMMARDLAPKVGRPGVWLRPEDLARIGRWTKRWKRRAGFPA